MPDVPAAPRQPHQDPADWARLLDTLDLSSVFVVLDAWLGPALRQQVQPEDVWQETLCCAWRDRLQHTWSTLSAYRAWLLTIARHRIADLARHQGRDKRGGGIAPARFSDLAAGEPVSHMLPAHTTTPSRIADHRERALSALLHQVFTFEDAPWRDELGLPAADVLFDLAREFRSAFPAPDLGVEVCLGA